MEKQRSKSLYQKKSHNQNSNTDLFEIDAYQTNNKGTIQFNERYLCEEDEKKRIKIIFDKPEILDLQDGKGKVCVPSILDCFVFKTDIITFSNSGLRPKDEFDLLFLISNFDDLQIKKAIKSILASSDSRKKFIQLNNLLSNFENIIKDFSSQKGFSLESNTGSTIINKEKILNFHLQNKIDIAIPNIT